MDPAVMSGSIAHNVPATGKLGLGRDGCHRHADRAPWLSQRTWKARASR